MQRTLWPIVNRLLANVPDQGLLERYVLHQDQDAFGQIVSRYNRLVWSQCRNLLVNDADADDAFQATFLTLARSAKTLKAGLPLGPWLHGVAYRVCMNARRAMGRRSKREKASARPEADDAVAESSWEKAFAAVAEEVQQLPENQRVAFVLCYLEGRPVAEAAAALGQKLGTFTARLSRAKRALLDRLARRGLGAGVVALGGVTGSAAVARIALVERTLLLLHSGVTVPNSVQSLTRGVTGMTLIHLKTLAAAVMLATGLGLGVGSGWLGSVVAQPPSAPVSPATTADGIPGMGMAYAPRFEYEAVPKLGVTQKEFEQKVADREKKGWSFVGQVSINKGEKEAVPMLAFRRMGGGEAGMGPLPAKTSNLGPAVIPRKK